MSLTSDRPVSIRVRTSPVISAAVRGDPEALSDVLSAARPQVYRWTLAKTGDVDDAEDVTQMVLLRLYSRLSAFKGESLLSSWLYRITANELSGFFRKRAREQEYSRRWWESRGREPAPPIALETIAHRQSASVVKEMARDLPPLQQATFQLVDVDGLRPCEAAKELGRTQTTIRSTLCRARKKVRELVEQCRAELVQDWVEEFG